MKISYRVTSGSVLIVFILIEAIELLFQKSPEPKTASTVGEAVVVGWNPCMMGEQLSPIVRLSYLVWFGTFVVVIVQGLRNRPVARWLSIVSLIALGITVNHVRWEWIHCYIRPSLTTFLVWVFAVTLMCVHQIVQRPVHV